MKKMRSGYWEQRGVSVITAVFVMLLLGVIAALMVNLMSTAQMTSAQDIEGSRAYQAARAGVEWGMYQLDPNAAVNALPNCFANTDLAQIPGFVVKVTCSRNTYTEGVRQIGIYQITATASNNMPPPRGVEREIQVRMERCLDPAITVAPFEC